MKIRTADLMEGEMMGAGRATWAKAGGNFLPALVHVNGRREVLYGPPLATRRTALKYALLELRGRLARKGAA